MGYLLLSSLTEEKNFSFSSSTCHTVKAIFYQTFINKQILKIFQRYPNALKRCGKNYTELLQELKNYFFSKESRSNQYFLFIRFVTKNAFINIKKSFSSFEKKTFVHNI